MIIVRARTSALLLGVIFLTGSVAVAQHDVGGGSTSDAATSDSSRGGRIRRAPARPAAVRRPAAPVRRGMTAEQYNRQGDTFFDAEQYDEAFEAYTKAVQLKPIASAHYHLGWIHNEREAYARALQSLRQATLLKSDYAEAFHELGYANRKLGRYQEAVAAFRQAINAKADYASPYFGLGDVYFYNTNQYADAITAYGNALALRPDNATANYNIGWSYNELKKSPLAVGPLQKAIALKPAYAEAYAELGYAYRKIERFNDAIRSYNEAIRLKPDYATPYFGLGDVYYYNLSQYENAIRAYQQP